MKFKITRVLTQSVIVKEENVNYPEWVYKVEKKDGGVWGLLGLWEDFGIYGNEALAKEVIHEVLNPQYILKP